jgi:hypothetical protein
MIQATFADGGLLWDLLSHALKVVDKGPQQLQPAACIALWSLVSKQDC